MKTPENEWTKLTTMPPLHTQVLVQLKDCVGSAVCDVACYIGKDVNGEGKWTLADVRLDTKQIAEWAHIFPRPPKSEIAEAAAIIRELLSNVDDARMMMFGHGPVTRAKAWLEKNA